MAIDIMMPFYGDISLLKVAVLSVQKQAGDWRLVVVDDRYPGTEQERFIQALGDNRIQYIANPVNLGIRGNFQRCVDLARAENTVIMGYDDVLMPNYISHLTKLIAQFPSADYIQPGVTTIDRTGRPNRALADRVKSVSRPRMRGAALLKGERLASSLLTGNWTYFPSLCWKTEVLKRYGFGSQSDIVLDLALQIEIVENGGTLLIDNGPIVFLYRRHSDSASSWSGKDDRRFSEEKLLFRALAESARARGWLVASRAADLHLTSRLHAASKIPAATFQANIPALRALGRHIFT